MKIKVFLLGVMLYLSPRAFLYVGARWISELNDGDEVERRVFQMNRKFWKSVALVLFVVAVFLILMTMLGYDVGGNGYWLRIVAVIIALTATLGRGGWEIQTWNGQSVLERIDRGMFKVSQLGAACLLILVLSL